MSVVGLLQQMMLPLMGQSSTKSAGADDSTGSGGAFDALLSQQLAESSLDIEVASPLDLTVSDEAVSEIIVDEASTEATTSEEPITLCVDPEPLPLSFVSPMPIVPVVEIHTTPEDTALLTSEETLSAAPTPATEEDATVSWVVLSAAPLPSQGIGSSYEGRPIRMIGQYTQEQLASKEVASVHYVDDSDVAVGSTAENDSEQDFVMTSIFSDFAETINNDADSLESTDKDELKADEANTSLVGASHRSDDGLFANNITNTISMDAATIALSAQNSAVTALSPVAQGSDAFQQAPQNDVIQGAALKTSMSSASVEVASTLPLPLQALAKETKATTLELQKIQTTQAFTIPEAKVVAEKGTSVEMDPNGLPSTILMADEPSLEKSTGMLESTSLDMLNKPKKSSNDGLQPLVNSRVEQRGNVTSTLKHSEQPISLPNSVVATSLPIASANGSAAVVNVSMSGTMGPVNIDGRNKNTIDSEGVSIIEVSDVSAISPSSLGGAQGLAGSFSPSSEVASNVVSQVVEGTVQAHLDSPTPARPTQVSLILNPEHLGSVRVQLTANPQGGPDAGAIQARFIVSTPEAQSLLTQQLETLSQRLESQNVKLDRVHIVLAPEGIVGSQASSNSTGSGLFQSSDQSANSSSQSGHQGSQNNPSYQEQADRQQWFSQLAGGFNGQGNPNHSSYQQSLYATPPKGLSPSHIPLMEGGQRAQSQPSSGVDHRIASGTTKISLLV